MTHDAESNKNCLVLIAHGSRNANWTAPFEKLVTDLKSEVGENRVYLAYMEHSNPTLFDIAAEIVQAGIYHFRLLPLFMSSGNHLVQDLPQQVEEAQSQFPGLKIMLLPPIGQQPSFFEFLRTIAKAHMS
jgi:sirohydrochlorin cobaltochelatase